MTYSVCVLSMIESSTTIKTAQPMRVRMYSEDGQMQPMNVLSENP